jgi:predicted RNA binding protein YcfA (HicA-like mRNA interferase family)
MVNSSTASHSIPFTPTDNLQDSNSTTYLKSIAEGLKEGTIAIYEQISRPIDNIVKPLGSLLIDMRIMWACQQRKGNSASLIDPEITKEACFLAKNRMVERAQDIKNLVNYFANALNPERVKMVVQFSTGAFLPFGVMKPIKNSKIIRNIPVVKAVTEALPSLPERTGSYTSKELIKIAQQAGYEVVPGGKGSHTKMKKAGCPTIIINKREFSKVELKKLWKTLEESAKKAPLIALPLLINSESQATPFVFEESPQGQFVMIHSPERVKAALATIRSQRKEGKQIEIEQEEDDYAEFDEEDVLDLEEGRSSLKARATEFNIHIPLDQMSQTTTTVKIPVGSTTDVGGIIPLASLKNSSLTVATTSGPTQMGAIVKPSNMKESTLSISQSNGKGNVGLGVNPFQLNKSTLTASFNAGLVNMGTAINIKDPKSSTLSATVPVYGVPVGIHAQLNKLHATQLTIGVPKTSVSVSVSVKKLFKNPKKAFRFGRKKKHRRKHKEHLVQTPPNRPTVYAELVEETKKLIESMRQFSIHSSNIQKEIATLSENSKNLDKCIHEKAAAIEGLKTEQKLLEKQIQVISQGPSLTESAQKLTVQNQELSAQVKTLNAQAPKLVAALKNKISPEQAAKLKAALAGKNTNK